MTYILVDIGGTNTRIAASSDLTTFTDPVKQPTPAQPEAGLQLIQEAVSALAPEGDIHGIVVGIRGQLDEDKQLVEHMQPNDPLLSWQDYPLGATLSEQYGCPVWMENDTALAGLGEAYHGAGQGFDLVVYHTISTGVGGVRIDCGSIDHASIGFEPGHQVLDIDRTVLGEDVTPTLENLVSGTAVEERMGVPPYEIPQDDTLWDMLAGYLGQGLRNTVLYWSPEVIVLGGSMIIGDPKITIDAIRRQTVAALDGYVDCPYITVASCGDTAPLYGAMVYAKQKTE